MRCIRISTLEMPKPRRWKPLSALQRLTSFGMITIPTDNVPTALILATAIPAAPWQARCWTLSPDSAVAPWQSEGESEGVYCRICSSHTWYVSLKMLNFGSRLTEYYVLQMSRIKSVVLNTLPFSWNSPLDWALNEDWHSFLMLHANACCLSPVKPLDTPGFGLMMSLASVHRTSCPIFWFMQCRIRM